MRLDGSRPEAIARGARLLADGRLLAFATETVYGLGARADADAAVAAIFRTKGRPANHPLIVHVADAAGIRRFASTLPDFAERLVAAFWPGPLTLILPRRAGVADAAAGGQPTIGLRAPSHPVARTLLMAAEALGVPGVAAPSANRFGRVSPTRAAHVTEEFGAELPVLDGGASEIGIESSIVDCSRGRPVLLRPGQLSRAALEAAAGRPVETAEEAAAVAGDPAAPRASGTLASHYAPSARVRLMSTAELHTALRTPAGGVGRLAVYSRGAPPAAAGTVLHRPMAASAAGVAHELFAVLREFDAAGVAAIWVEAPPPGSAWDGVRDRLVRAAT